MNTIPTIFPGGNDNFSTPSQPSTTTLASAGDALRNHTQHHQDLGDAVAKIERNVALLNHDHSSSSAPRATNRLDQQNTHQNADTDLGPLAIHHTLGPKRTNASPGDHTHPAGVAYVPPKDEWFTFTPTLYYGGGNTSPNPGGNPPLNLGTGGYSVGTYILIDKVHLYVQMKFMWGSPPFYGGSGAIYTFLPKNFISNAQGDNHTFAKLFTQPRTGPLKPPHTGQNWIGDTYTPPNSNLMSFAFPWAESNCSLANYRMALNVGVTDEGVPLIPGGFPEGGELFCEGHIEIYPPK